MRQSTGPSSARRRRRFVHRILLLALLIASSAAWIRAHAQGTSGTLPNPMTTQELDGYAKRLKLSPQQRQALQTLHDEYKREFRALREGEIAQFMKDMHALQGSGAMPERDAINSFLKKMDHLSNRIAAIDNRMLDQMQPLLTDEQLALMPRIKLARQRERYRGQQVMMMSGSPLVDLSELMLEIQPTPEAAQAADAVLGPYESKLTTGMSRQMTATTHMIADLYDALAQMGFDEESFKDPETAQKMGEAMQAAWRDLGRKVTENAAELNALNQRTYRSLAAVLPPDAARSLRDRFYEQAYPEARFVWGMEQATFTRALELDSLAPEQRAAVESTRDDWQRKIDSLTDQAVALVDEHRKTASPFDWNQEESQQYQVKLGELRQKATEASSTAMAAVNDLLGPELAKKVQADAAAHMAKNASSRAAMLAQRLAGDAGELDGDGEFDGDEAEDDGENEGEEAALEENVWMGDQFVPTRISVRDLADYAQRLGLNDLQRAALEGIHKSYAERMAQVSANEVAALMKANSGLWSWDEQTQTSRAPTTEQLEQVHRARRAAIDAVRRADAEFFADVELAVVTPEQAPLLEKVRRARERFIYSRGQDQWFFGYGGSSSEWRVDLHKLTRELKLSESASKSVSEAIEEYEIQSLPLMRTRFERAIEFQQMQERWNAEVMAAQSDGQDMGAAMRIASRYQELMSSVGKQATEANKALAQLNRQALDRVLAAIPIEHADRLREAYNKAAYPTVYEDPAAVTRHLGDALRLNDLTDAQQRRLADLAAEYRPAYAELCDQMIQVNAEADVGMYWGMDPEQMRKMQEREEALSRLRFDRSELNARAANVLRITLTEDQLKRLGDLPQPDKNSGIENW